VEQRLVLYYCLFGFYIVDILLVELLQVDLQIRSLLTGRGSKRDGIGQ
jgi:hypothetical protein